MSLRTIFTSALRKSTTAAAAAALNAELKGVVDHVQATTPAERPVDRKEFSVDRTLVPLHLSYDVLAPSRTWHYRHKITPTSRQARPKDLFYQLDLDPRDFSMNAPLLYEFVSEMGKINPRATTELTAKSQRLLAKAIRRAKHMGIMALHSKPLKPSKSIP